MNLKEQHQSLILQKMKLDKFFSMFLEKYERKMDCEKTNTPIWKLYKSKLKEYDDVQHKIRTTEYWMKKEHHV
jgi:hypothetical protein